MPGLLQVINRPLNREIVMYRERPRVTIWEDGDLVYWSEGRGTTIIRQPTRLTTRNQQQLPTDSSTRQSTVNNHHPTTDTPDNQESTTITDNQQSADYCWLSTNKYGYTDRYTRRAKSTPDNQQTKIDRMKIHQNQVVSNNIYCCAIKP